MNYEQYADTVLKELQHTLQAVDAQKAEAFTTMLDEADEVFCAGAGRSGFEVKGFAMRLMHMGLKSYVVGETCTPNIAKGGLLVVAAARVRRKAWSTTRAKRKKSAPKWR